MAQLLPTDSRDISEDPLSLEEILTVFNNPINEEQAWAVCHQCANYFLLDTARRTFRDLYTHGIRSVRIKKDGDVIIDATEVALPKVPQVHRRNSVTGKDIKVVTESDAIQALGVVIYHALDYGLQESEERHLSHNLEHLLEVMINPDEEDDEELQNACDEGIEKDAKEGYTFADIIVLCSQHISSDLNVGQHYKAVCKALVAEAEELLTFLNRISSGKKQLEKVVQDEDQARLEELQRSDWARLWVQIMKELRRGVRLKAVEHITTPTEYELTPFEILLDDIKSHRYTLNKVMVNGDIPPKVKKDAHAVILDFIRSRPPLHPVKKRVLNSPPKIELQPREQILQEIRSKPKLRPAKERKIVETSRTKLNNEDEEECPQPVRKVIKPDFTLFLDSFDESENDNDSSMGSSHSSISSPSPEKDSTRWRRAVVRDVATTERHGNLERRHTIMVCESPQVFPSTPRSTAQLQVDATEHKLHESRGKLRRSAPVSKSRACVNDVRQKRMSLPLHGIHEEDSVEFRSLHDPACGFNSVSEENDISEDYVFDRSQGLRMPITRSQYQSLKRSATITESGSSSQTISKSKSSDVKERPRPMVRARSISDMKPSVLVRARNVPRSQHANEVSSQKIDIKEGDKPKTTELEDSSPKPKPRPAPRTSITRSNSLLTRPQSDSETKEVDSDSTRSRVISDRESSKVIPKGHSSVAELKVRRKSSETLSSVEGETSGERVRRSSRHSEKSPNRRSDKSPSRRSDKSPRRRTSEGSGEESSRRHHRESSPSSRRHRDSSSPSRRHKESHHKEESPRRHRREGRDESVHSEVVKSDGRSHHSHRHRRRSEEEATQQNTESDKFLRQSKDRVPLRRSTHVSGEGQSERSVTPDRKSSSDKGHNNDLESPKPEVKVRRSVQLNHSEEGEKPSVQLTPLSPVISSAEPVQRRSKLQAVNRSQSQRNFYRHSTDFSGSSAIIPEVNTSTSTPVSRGIMLGRYRKEAEELLKPIHQEEEVNSEIPDKVKDRESPERSPKLSELNVSELLHKWKHPIECLSLTLEEVTHIRQVLTKAELETLITNHEMYNLVSKGKVCFTCKLVKFSMFGQWGTRCKICKRNVCNNCLRKMNIPTEHFQNIPVHTLSPIPLSQDILDVLKVYESTGSVPHTPCSERKAQPEIENVTPKRKSLQRSHTIGAGSAPALPNKNLLKGPQMSVCCDCKSMIMEIIRSSRTSIARINKGQGTPPSPDQEEEKGEGLNLSTLSLNIKQFFNK
ncbi:protein spire homolog 1-like isoform X2 [Saccostrea echinata]|uniref:protein spire homolog 1-like isoform X2 n=1 Tax=Saccostrea echinata TaxID=191078 RepID=UPI002A8224B2|nr:protein spire homolog 1-like isoform X2 [Saccostrea echinata]